MDDTGTRDQPSILRQTVARRTVLKGIGAGTAVALLPDHLLSAALGNPSAIINRTASLVVSVVRPDDFLRLTFRFVNLTLDTSIPASPVLLRKNLTIDSAIVVDFGPQHVAEQVLWDPGVTDSIPAAVDGIGARLAGNSRLAFVVPTNVNTIPYDIDTLLEWTTLTQSVVPVALPGVAEGAATRAAQIIKFVFPALRDPQQNETAIEVPWWLVLSPTQNAAWAHATQPVTHNGRTELWHTRLASKSGNTIDEAHPDTLRAVWGRDPKFKQYLNGTAAPPDDSPAHNQLPPPGPNDPGLPFRMAYSPDDRVSAVRNSADFSKSNPLLLNRYTPTPFKTDRLMLTALGAYVDIDGSWQNSPFNNLVEWKNRSTLGRDHYVRIVHKGYLMPLGHRAVLVLESERKFLNGTGNRSAYLVLRTFFVVVQPERTYPASQGLPSDGRNFPFQKVEVITRISPDYSSTQTVGNANAFLPLDGGGDPIRLHFRGTDWEGNTATFDAPFVFVADVGNAPYDETIMGSVNDAYKLLPAVQRTANLGGDKVAFAPSDKPGDTTFPVESLVFGAINAADNAAKEIYKAADQLRGFPLMDVGHIRLPDVEKLAGDDLLKPAVRFVDDFVKHEFDDALNKGKAFLKFVDPAIPVDPNDPLKDVKQQALNFANENAGGLVNPSQALTGITRDLGPVAGKLEDLVNNKFDPDEVLQDLTAKIMGGLPLKDIIDAVTDLTGQAEKAMQFLKQQLPTEIVINFVWKPDLKPGPAIGSVLDNTFVPSTSDPKATASLQGEFRQSLTDPNKRSAKFSGEITNFTLNLLGDSDTLFLKITVSKLGFKSGTGQKTDIDVKIDNVEFAGALQFVEQLRTILENLGDGFGVKVDGKAITAKMNLEIPAVSVGVFGLSNLAFNAGITVPLTGDPVRVRFGLSTRDNPFIIQVYVFGGGGWFGLAIGTDGVELVEVGLEFGGKLAFDVGVASGGVEAMAGIYLKIAKGDKGDTCVLEGFLKIDGHVSVLGIVSVELEIYLSFQFMHKPPDTNIVTGTAKATLKVSVLFFSTSVTIEVQKSFGGDPKDPSFAQAISPPNWADYVNVFAAV